MEYVVLNCIYDDRDTTSALRAKHEEENWLNNQTIQLSDFLCEVLKQHTSIAQNFFDMTVEQIYEDVWHLVCKKIHNVHYKFHHFHINLTKLRALIFIHLMGKLYTANDSVALYREHENFMFEYLQRKVDLKELHF
jgi:hypothetical protein